MLRTSGEQSGLPDQPLSPPSSPQSSVFYPRADACGTPASIDLPPRFPSHGHSIERHSSYCSEGRFAGGIQAAAHEFRQGDCPAWPRRARCDSTSLMKQKEEKCRVAEQEKSVTEAGQQRANTVDSAITAGSGAEDKETEYPPGNAGGLGKLRAVPG